MKIKMEGIKGFKVFNPDWTCRGFQYEVGKTYEENVKPRVCDRGFHFCKKPQDCFSYYKFDPSNKVAEVIALGEVAEEGDKCSTNKIHIVRELTWEEILNIVNTGKENAGLCNTGNLNTGNRNTGNKNSGHRNTGHRNTGHRNTGGWNYGNRNTGNWNAGDLNTGDSNTGNYNTGDWNNGNRNVGHKNTGNYNTGECNTGDRNTGNYNSGDYNTGHYNSGDYNTGDWNMASNVVGCFNTESQKLRFFDKETDMTFKQWRNSEAYYLLRRIKFEPNQWVWSEDMTEEEKDAHPEHETAGGFLKVRDNTDRFKYFKEWWNKLTEREKEVIKNIPNFDAEKFFIITGIRVE